MDDKINNLLKIWPKKNISGMYCADKEAAAAKIMELIPSSSSVGISGSKTLEQLAMARLLDARGNKVFNPYKPGLSREESLSLRQKGAQEADYYLASANALSEKGELVFFSAFGNRTAGISYARNVIIVCGINKITPGLPEALARARECATPLNCKRLDWLTPCLLDGICRNQTCLFPEYKRMCCQILIIEADPSPDRIKVILVGENLGF